MNDTVNQYEMRSSFQRIVRRIRLEPVRLYFRLQRKASLMKNFIPPVI
jgi:hypothetical protein